MPTPIFICGAECGVAGVNTASGGVEHWSAVGTTSPTIDTSVYNQKGLGVRSLRLNPSNSMSWIEHTFAAAIASGGTTVVRAAFRFDSWPTNDCHFISLWSGTNVIATVNVGTVDPRPLTVYNWGGSFSQTSVKLELGKWYYVDFKFTGTATRVATMRLDGQDEVSTQFVSTATTITKIRFGDWNNNQSYDLRIDDIVVSGTSGDYPIGPGGVCALYPNGDGTHAYNGAQDFTAGTNGSGDLAIPSSAETTTWQKLNKPIPTSIPTTYIRNWLALTDLSEYLTHTYEDLPEAVATIHGAMLVLATHSVTANSNNTTVRLGTTTILTADLSETTITIPCVIRNTDSAGAAWTPTSLNALTTRWTSSDNSPSPFLDGICFEVAYAAPVPISTFPKTLMIVQN